MLRINGSLIFPLLWVQWTDIDKDYEKAFPLYEQWGIAGVKIDFMNRDDQQMVEWYHTIFKKVAEHHLMVNFHGAYKPTGIRRTYPNVIAREGVMGNEYNKWSDRMTPEHNVTIAFTRNLLGQMDFTPGGFLNRAKGQLRVNVTPTQVMGTRCHQLAMFIVYDSPLTTMCDDPVNYENQPGLEFLKIVPTVWDDMKALNGEVAQYITVAKKSGKDWFIGSLNNSDPRELTITLDFLDSGKYEAWIYQDVPESKVDAEKLEEMKMTVDKGKTLKLKMASGGGFAAYLKKINS
jgi:alpha-glucosidase